MNLESRLHRAGLDKGEVVDVQRRLFLRTGLTLGAATLLSGCDVITNTAPVDGFLRMISSFNDGVQAALFSPNRLAPTFPEHMVAPTFRYNGQYGPEKIHKINPDTWRLEVSGLVSDKTPWTLDRLKSLPQRADVTRHVCVEGWSMIGKWGGVPLRTFLEKVGADMSAKYVAFRCDDPVSYDTSIDMASAMHPQTIMCADLRGQAAGADLRRADARQDPDQARLQAAEVRLLDPRDEPVSGRLLGALRLQLVRRALTSGIAARSAATSSSRNSGTRISDAQRK